MLYLNTPDKGGETNFLNPRDEEDAVRVRPRAGLALVFDHNLLHEGGRLVEGIKYAVRTDVMFERIPDDVPEGPRILPPRPGTTAASAGVREALDELSLRSTGDSWGDGEDLR